MSGYNHDPLLDIYALKKLLHDQYDPLSILKELIQNADDAMASQLQLGWLPGIPDAVHPLLRAPAIVVLNDGPLEEDHLEALQLLGAGSKGSDQTAIGKFGLGMKSVFHLCEAFFYLASPNQPAAHRRPLANILNPWGGACHTDWDSLPYDRCLLTRLAEGQHGLESWFCLWLPLRRAEHLGGVPPIVHPEPNPVEFFTDLPQRVAPLMPLLRCVQSVTQWSADASGQPVVDAVLSVSEGSRRRIWTAMDPGKRNDIRGAVDYAGPDDARWTLSFAGHEQYVDHPELRGLRADKEWPTCVTLNRKTLQPEPEKEIPHAAAVFSALPSPAPGSGELLITFAAFLPLTEPIVKKPCTDNLCFQLLLHGGFFLDAGRSSIESDNALEARTKTIHVTVHAARLPSEKAAKCGVRKRTEREM